MNGSYKEDARNDKNTSAGTLILGATLVRFLQEQHMKHVGCSSGNMEPHKEVMDLKFLNTPSSIEVIGLESSNLRR
jgi:hypothetical protein